MSKINIVLPDKSVKSFDSPPNVLDVAKSISEGLARDTLGARINGGEIVDWRSVLNDGDQLEIITSRSPDSLEIIRHSAAHVMAQAVQELWPDVQVTIGPVIEDGFYYDFYSPRSFHPEDLEKIEKKMKELIKSKTPVTKQVMKSNEAISVFRDLGEDFKCEIIEDLNQEEVSVYYQGEWFDLCRGPHVQHLGQIKAVKVLSIAGAYWRGDETKAQLQRVYATAFNDKKDLREYLERLEEAKKRDHRKLGKELGWFYFSQLSPGAPFFTGKGTTIYNELANYVRELYVKYGYEEVITPQIYDVALFERSGHYGNYSENMYFTEVDSGKFSVKPMNCPGHCVLFGSEHHSYKELPRRIADFGRLHRYERSGVIQGLTRVRSFCQDDAHIFCTEEQLEAEIIDFMKMLHEAYSKLGLNSYHVALSTRPEKRMGSDEVWDRAEKALAKALEKIDIPFDLQEGEGAFYGPKIEIVVKDALGRAWQMGTAQCDFVMPENFELKYIGEDNSEHQPVMLHRAVLGSIERFIGVYTEHTAGKLPTWLHPTQVKILNVTDRQLEYCQEIYKQFLNAGLRVELDSRNEKLGYKIREATLERIPYMLIIGDKELEEKNISVRLRSGENKNSLSVESFLNTILQEIKNKDVTGSLA